MKTLRELLQDSAVIAALRSKLTVTDGPPSWDTVKARGALVGVANGHYGSDQLILPDLPHNAIIPMTYEGEMLFCEEEEMAGMEGAPKHPSHSIPAFDDPALAEWCKCVAIY